MAPRRSRLVCQIHCSIVYTRHIRVPAGQLAPWLVSSHHAFRNAILRAGICSGPKLQQRWAVWKRSSSSSLRLGRMPGQMRAPAGGSTGVRSRAGPRPYLPRAVAVTTMPLVAFLSAAMPARSLFATRMDSSRSDRYPGSTSPVTYRPVRPHPTASAANSAGLGKMTSISSTCQLIS